VYLLKCSKEFISAVILLQLAICHKRLPGRHFVSCIGHMVFKKKQFNVIKNGYIKKTQLCQIPELILIPE